MMMKKNTRRKTASKAGAAQRENGDYEFSRRPI